MNETNANTMTLVPAAKAELNAEHAFAQMMDNEHVRIMAKRFPRDEKAILQRAFAELEMAPREAAKSWYSIPYNDRAGGRTVLVEGLSYGSAMQLVRLFGNCTVTTQVISEDDDGWTLMGTFLDFESGVRIARPYRGSKWEKRRGLSGAVKLDAQRELMAFQSAVSKCMRNVALSCLPVGMKSAFWSKARELSLRGETSQPANAPAGQAKVTAIVSTFGKWNVQQAQLERLLDTPASAWTESDVVTLRGVWRALEDGETSVEAAFPREEAGAPAPPSVGERVVIETAAILAGETEGRDGAEPGRQTTEQAPTNGPATEAAPAPKRRGRPPKVRSEFHVEQEPAAEAPAPVPPAPAPAEPVSTAVPTVEGLDADTLGALLAEIDACETTEQIDAVMGRVYRAGGASGRMSRVQRQEVARAVQARRAEIAG